MALVSALDGDEGGVAHGTQDDGVGYFDGRVTGVRRVCCTCVRVRNLYG